MKKPIKKAVSYAAIDDKGNILLVKRPADDKDLPNVWGLPAGGVKEDESWEKATVRSGKEKLGVNLEIKEELGEGKLDREKYTLHMKLFGVSIPEGEKPVVPQPLEGITQYVDSKWATPDEIVEHLKITAPQGSLCCTLFLVKKGVLGERDIKAWHATLVKNK